MLCQSFVYEEIDDIPFQMRDNLLRWKKYKVLAQKLNKITRRILAELPSDTSDDNEQNM